MESHHKVSVIRRFSDRTHKEMETISGCQDNFQSDTANNCFAIADGATQSFYSSIWSKLLVDYFCENPQIDKNNWQEWLESINKQYGEFHELEPLPTNQQEVRNPLSELEEIVGRERIIPIIVGE
jgi:serine/threonine protein phosphatase PrpC